jgi:hypothetical protein
MKKTDNLHIAELRKQFSRSEVIETSDVMEFFARFDPRIPRSTVNWRVYHLVEKGILQRVGRGKFRIAPVNLGLGRAKAFEPQISKKTVKIHRLLDEAFPYINYCLWSSKEVNAFTQHLTKADLIFVDCERDVMESVFFHLRDSFSSVYLDPDIETIKRYVIDVKEAIVVRSLATHAPLQKVKSVPTITIEKLLVDVFSDDEFYYLKGKEMDYVFMNAFGMYAVNESTMLRYADRKGKKRKFKLYLSEIQQKM